MKKLYFKAFLLLALNIFTLSCTDDPIQPDDPDTPNPNTPASYFKFDGKYFELTKGYLKIFSSGSSMYSLYLTGPNINYDTDLGTLNGTDQTVLINFILPENSITLPVHDFPFCTGAVEENEYTSLRFDTNYTYSPSGVLNGYENRRDTVHVTKTGNIFNITYTGYDVLLNSFEIKYKGTITYIN